MLKIVICDDDTAFRRRVASMVDQIALRHKVRCSFTEYSSGEAFIENIDTLTDRDLLIIDMLMDGIDGMEVARKVREYSNDISILFASSHIKFSPEGYMVKAIGYILKDDFFERNLTATLDMVIPDIIKKNNIIELKTSDRTIKVKASNIICVESDNHNVIYYLGRNEGYSVRERFKDVAINMADYDFLLIHRGCIVNPAFVKAIKKSYIVLEPDWEINISRSLYKSVQEKYQIYKQLSV